MDYPKSDQEIIEKAQEIADRTPPFGVGKLFVPINLGPTLMYEENKGFSRNYRGQAMVELVYHADQWQFVSLK